jgi:hypothetical protein
MADKKTFKFDKFIKDIRNREKQTKKKLEDMLTEHEELPQRTYNKLYREKWQNSVRYRRKK